MRLLCISILTGLALGAAACGEDEIAKTDLIDTWNATSMVYRSVAGPAQHVDVIQLGETFKITLNANNTYSSVSTEPGQNPETETGTWSSSIDVLTIVRTGSTGSTQFDMELSGNRLTLSGGHVEYDFDGNEVYEAAECDLVLVRE